MSRLFHVVVTLTWLASCVSIGNSCARTADTDDNEANCTISPGFCDWKNADGNNPNWNMKTATNRMVWEARGKTSSEGSFTSSRLCSTENRLYDLTFRYKISTNPSVCNITVTLQAEKTHELWIRNRANTNWETTNPPLTVSSPYSSFKIVFLATKMSTEQRRYCGIRIDTIQYSYTGMNISLPPTTTTASPATEFTLQTTTLETTAVTAKTSTASSLQPNNEDTGETTGDAGRLQNTGDSDPGAVVGIGLALFVVVVGVVIIAVVVHHRRRKHSEGSTTCLGMPTCLQRRGQPRPSPSERLRPTVHNAAYSSEDDQFILNGRLGSGCKGGDHAYDLAKMQPNTDYCNVSTPVPTTASVSANATRLENTYFELEAEPSARGNTHPGESLYEVTDGTEFEDHSVSDDAQTALGRGTVQSGDNLGYELATLPKTDIYCTPRNTDATKNPGAGNHTSSVHNQTTGVKAGEYNKLSRRNPRTDVRRNDDYHHFKKGEELKPSQIGTAQYSMAQLQDEYNHLNEGGELKPGQIGIAEDEYNHLTQEQDRQKPAQLATSEYCVAKPTESGVTDRHTNERATNYINVSLTDNATEDEYNRLDFEKNPSLPAAGKGSGGEVEGDEYNHLKAESCQHQDDEYNNLNFRRSDQPSEEGQGSDVYNRLSNDRT